MREISSIKGRILKYLDFSGVTKYDCYKNTGITNGVLSQKGGLSEENLLRFLSHYKDINTDWLISGKGDMLKNADSTVSRNVNSEEKENAIYLYDTSAAAGFGSFDEMISQEKIVGKYIVPDFRNVDWMISVKGSSMYPKYSSGDIIACRVIHDSKFIQWGKVYVIATIEQGLLVKRLEECDDNECLLAVSDNKNYKPFSIPKSEIVGIALVVGVIRME